MNLRRSPIHFEVIADGKEDYVDPAIGHEGFSPEYGAITASDFQQGNFPDIPYVVLNIMYIPEYETRLTFTAFVISGNESYYEAIDGLCHPDCPSWPECLDVPSLTCTAVLTPAQIPTLDPYHEDEREDFPNYLFDDALGYYGSVEETSGRIPDPPINPGCNPPCVETYFVQWNPQTGLFDWLWGCDCDIEDDGGGGPGGPPSRQTEECGCYVYIDDRKPGGKISVEDTQIDDEGVRKIKVKTAPKNFGFIWKTTNTDNNGCWKIDKRYNVKRLKIKAVFKDKVTDRMIIRSLRGARFWNAFLKPVKHRFLEKRNNREWNSLCLLLEDSINDDSRDEQSYVAAITNNAVHEFYEDHTDLPSPGKLKILLNNIDERLNTAPMFHFLDKDLPQNVFEISDLNYWFSAYIPPYIPVVTELISVWWEFSKPDILIYFGNSDPTDKKKKVIYHELTHASHYATTGPIWWNQFVRYILNVGQLTNVPKPYGDDVLSGSGRAELTEGITESFENVVADAQYGLNHSNGAPVTLFRHNYIAERLGFWNPSSDFIPEGLYYDLFDQNGVFPTGVTNNELDFVTDETFGFSFEEQIQIFDNHQVHTIEEFKTRLWLIYGASSGSTLSQYNNLFESYGH